MSPVLKEAVPVGSLECRTVKFIPASVVEKRKVDTTRRGWKMDSFANAADRIAAAGSRLQEEAERESRYWEQISNLKAKGWAISRLPRDSRTAGVHFGFAEAAPAFRSRGFATLRQGQDGNIRLDHGAIPPRPLIVAVTVSVDGQESGSSAIHHEQVTDDSPIESHIMQAHNTLSEEELFHEISREGRLLANQGVEISSKSIEFDVGNKFNVQIRLLEPGREPPPANSSVCAEETAKVIALSLRILLAHAHQQTHQRRSNTPSPMTLKAKAIPEYALLRPVMSHLQHDCHLRFLRTFTASVLPPLSNAGIDLPARFKPMTHWNLPPSSESCSLQASDLLNPLLAPLESTMTLELPTKRTLELTVRTFVGPPIFGTEFSIRPLTYGAKNLISPRLETDDDVERFVCHVIMMDLAALIEGLHSASGNGEKVDETSENGAHSSAQPSLRVNDLHSGELLLRKVPGSIEKLQVRVVRNWVGLRHVSKIIARRSADTVPYVWEADKSWKTTASGGREDTNGLPLSEVVKRIVSRDDV